MGNQLNTALEGLYIGTAKLVKRFFILNNRNINNSTKYNLILYGLVTVLLLTWGIVLFGCSDDGRFIVGTDDNTTVRNVFFTRIMILQEYYDDTLYIGCILYDINLTEDFGVYTVFNTLDSITYINGIKVSCRSMTLIYDSNIYSFYKILETEHKRYFYGGGVDNLELEYNHKYYIIFGPNKN